MNVYILPKSGKLSCLPESARVRYSRRRLEVHLLFTPLCQTLGEVRTPARAVAANMPLQLSIPPQGHRCRIEAPTQRRACS